MAQPALPTTSLPSPPWQRPPILRTADGAERKVGIEIEFAGLDVDEACALVRRLYGGTIVPINRFGSMVRGTSLGDFRVELDSMPLKKEKYKRYLEKVGAGSRLTGVVEDVLESIVSTFVPAEIVTAPIPIADAPRLESLRWALHARNAGW